MMLFLYEKKSGNAFAFKRTFCIFANKTIGILEKDFDDVFSLPAIIFYENIFGISPKQSN